ncbi:hypothetical protein MAR_028476 [Mya arenaria]|uniref:THAP-type domain-containing protein n=1 Tax=Mya arenaria TaxID=6604 RepID=A0ABY7DFN1_MYAAR|nr:hypothetical protein MAR_028476 [Mya arenaria]
MPTSCSAPGCTQRFVKDSGVHFLKKKRRLKWLLAIGRRSLNDSRHVKLWEPSAHDRLCSMHFVEGTPSKDPYHQDYIPSVFSFATTAKQPEQTPVRADRFKRLQRRRLVLTPNDKENCQPANDLDEIAEPLLLLGHNLPQSCDQGTDPEPDPIRAELDKLNADYTSLQKDDQRIKKTNFTYKNLSNREVSTLTGLQSMAMFTWLLATVSDVIKPVGKLCRGNVLLMVLMKLRLNITNNDLAMRFQTCLTQVSRVLTQSLPNIAKRIKFLLQWPSFKKNYKKCRVIIDCSEIFIQRPTNLDARASTWSNYKSHNTLKFLIDITPYGSVSFQSKCWGGRVSDKEITTRSGFYELLEVGDLVLADRGFLIADELAAHGATLAIPPFAKGKSQFSQREVECARILSKSRIHVERAIERVKRFQILKNTLPISLIRHADSILTICAAFTNLLPKHVK